MLVYQFRHFPGACLVDPALLLRGAGKSLVGVVSRQGLEPRTC
jgi:hypothetical protein